MIAREWYVRQTGADLGSTDVHERTTNALMAEFCGPSHYQDAQRCAESHNEWLESNPQSETD